MNNFRPEIHVAQQSRRDRLRVLHQASGHSLAFTSNVNQLPLQDGLNYEAAPRNYQQCEPSGFCSEINYFPELGQRNCSIAHQELENNISTEIPADNFNQVSDCSVINRGPQPYFSTWKSTGSQSPTDTCWLAANQGPNLVSGSGLPGVSSLSPRIFHREINTALLTSDAKPRLQTGGIHFGPSSFNHNPLEELVCSSGFATVGSLSQKSSEGTSHGPWAVDSGELFLLSGLKGPHDLMSRPVGTNLWSGGPDQFTLAKDGVHNTQGLALSLSSVPSSKAHVTMFAEGDVHSREVLVNMNSSAGDKVSRNARQGAVGSQASMVSRSPGPLGPFTGYATILRSSRYLWPTQVVLEELCCMAQPVNDEICEGLGKILEEDRVSGEDDGEPGMKAMSGDSSGSLFGFNGVNDKNWEAGDTSGWMNSCRPENFQKKAKLLYMQDEVSKRYKQYHQQMQMVVSSFESVAGLSTATPYISLALKMVCKNFRCLKNSITEQLKSIRGAMGEEPSSSSAGANGGKGGASGSMLKFFDQSFQKPKGANSAGFLQGPLVWRPQRGLPERAVSILRAWLFEHFLHPYPTDTDKHMLAAQTGLTRNQVSNWFINARVRVWKPMVEEIHILETKGNSETGTDVKTATAICGQLNDTAGQCSNTLRRTSYSSPDPNEKRSRMDYHHMSNSGSLFVTSDGVEIPGLGPVSLTLGLRQSEENGRRIHYGDGVIREDLLADF